MFLHFLVLGLFWSSCGVFGVNFDVNHVVNIKLNASDKIKGSYFGYSLLLQSGSRPMVIVGAPKQSKKKGGSVFACDILKNNGCIKYSTATANGGSFNGNFLGASIDGEDEVGRPFITCAPRKVLKSGNGSTLNYFFKGTCFYHINSSLYQRSDIEYNSLKVERTVGAAGADDSFYNYAFGQAGMNFIYQKKTFSLIQGAVGIKNWNGAIVIQRLKVKTDHLVIPRRQYPVEAENHNYLGYTVGQGLVEDTLFLFAGAPRAEELLGKVKLFESNSNAIYRSFIGQEVGSYFGSAALSEDVNNDGSDDLFIGAPTAAGNSYDEGCVYFYKNAIETAITLTGNEKTGGRFGSTIVALGDIDLDSYNDVAIAAPFEEDGMGVVYIYMGQSDGIKRTHSQRIVPSTFPGRNLNVRGFGMGMSRGNDIDGNGHNDLAIGAFQSSNVFVVPTIPVIIFRTALEPNLTSITANDNKISIQFCVYFAPQSEKANIKSVNFGMTLILDYRVKGVKTHFENVLAFRNAKSCRNIDVEIEHSVVDLTPFHFSLKTNTSDNVYAYGKSILQQSILYSHRSGDEHICPTEITVDVYTETREIILGLNEVINVHVTANNAGEPGYQCQLHMEVPKVLQLRQEQECTIENLIYVCPFASRIQTEFKKLIVFDINKIYPSTENFNITFEIKCLGENLENREILNIGVIVQNSPYIEGKSEPENFENTDENAKENTEVILYHTYILGNFGPSPAKMDMYLLLPTVQINNENLFQVVEAIATLRGIQVPCYLSNETKSYSTKVNVGALVKASLNRTILIDCFEDRITCLEYFCAGDYLYTSSETAKLSLKIKTKTNLLAKYFEQLPDQKNIIAFTTSGFLYNGTRIESHAITLLLSSQTSSVPFWVYIVASVVGLLLLYLIIFIFHKCHFFDRRYRDKLNSERLMNHHIEVNDDQKTPEDTPTEVEES